LVERRGPMSEPWMKAMKALAEQAGWREPVAEKHQAALAYLVGASREPDLKTVAVEEEIEREAKSIRELLEAQERFWKAEALHEAIARTHVDMSGLKAELRNTEQDRAHNEIQPVENELADLRQQWKDSVARLVYLHRLRANLRSAE
jgi:hypothetical protein